MVSRTDRTDCRPTWCFVTTVRLSRSGIAVSCRPGRALGVAQMTAGVAVKDAAGSASVPGRQRKPLRWAIRPIGLRPASPGSLFGWGSAAEDGREYTIAVSRLDVDRLWAGQPGQTRKKAPDDNLSRTPEARIAGLLSGRNPHFSRFLARAALPDP